MKVLNLQCAARHGFEGWFASEDDFQAQLATGLVACPLCADTSIQKLPSAPRLNLGAQPVAVGTADAADVSPQSAPGVPAQAGAASGEIALTGAPSAAARPEQAAFLTALRQLVARTENVGPRFAEEARRMHYGEIEARSIRGQASAREAVELLEEGIAVMPLPLPAALKETLQ